MEEILIEKEKVIDILSQKISEWGNKFKVYKNGRSLIIVPADSIIDPNHPFIASDNDICGGEPVILGTRVTVRAVVEYQKLYGSIENILRSLSHINKKQIEDALSFYADHTEQIDRYIAENSEAFQQKLYKEWKTQKDGFALSAI